MEVFPSAAVLVKDAREREELAHAPVLYLWSFGGFEMVKQVEISNQKFVRRAVPFLIVVVFLLSIVIVAPFHTNNSSHQNLTAIQIGMTKPIESALPLKSHWPSTRFLVAAIHRDLVSKDEQGNLMPMLAESVPTLENGEARLISTDRGGEEQLVVTFRLREGLRWSDGKPLTSADVKFTYDLLRQAGFTGNTAAQFIERIDTPDERTAVVIYQSGFKDPRYNQPFGEAIYPAHILSGVPLQQIEAGLYAQRPIGAGPYRVIEWRYVGTPREQSLPGVVAVSPDELFPAAQVITLEANPYYFRGRPQTGRIIIRVIPDENTLLEYLRRGDTDIIAENSLLRFNDGVKQAVEENFVLECSPGMRWERLDFNLVDEHFSDVRVRQAVAYAIDRPAIVDALFEGHGKVMNSWIPSSNWAHIPALIRYHYDPEHSIQLLEEAGYAIDDEGFASRDGERLSVRLHVADGNVVREQCAALVQGYLKAIGFDVTVRTVHPGTLLGASGLLVTHRFGLALFSWQGDYEPRGADLWHSHSIPKAENGWNGNNFSGCSDSRNDLLLEHAMSLRPRCERAKWYHAQQALFAETIPSIPLFEYPNLAVRSPRLRGFKLPVGPLPSTWNIEEWYLSNP